MKFLVLLAALLSSSHSFASTCEKVSTSVSKCTAVYATYNIEVSNCSETIQTINGFFKFFTLKNVNLEKIWLEDSNGIVPQSLSKQVRYSGERITKSENVCLAFREEEAAKIVSQEQRAEAIRIFLNTP